MKSTDDKIDEIVGVMLDGATAAAADESYDLTPVVLESPYAGDVERNVRYARACLHDCIINHREAGIASHLLYTQPGVLDDDDEEQRALGIEAGLLWGRFAKRTVVYTDLGISSGMRLGIASAHAYGREVVMRTLPGWTG